VKDTGSYRSKYDAIWKDLDYRHLSPIAKCVLDLLKSELGRYGIDVCDTDAFHKMVNCTTDEIAAALDELERPKPGRARGWIVRDEHMIWIVNGLKYEPSITLGNPNHWSGARKFADELPNLPIVADFLDYYGLLGDPPATAPKSPKEPKKGDSPSHADGMGDGIPHPMTNPLGDHRDGNRDGYGDGDRKRNIARAREAVPIPGLPAGAARFVARFYDTATEKRRQEVIGQLRAAIQPNGQGARLSKGVRVRAHDESHLERVCADVIGDPPDKADVAIVWVLRKLGDLVLDARGRTPGEARAEEDEQRRNVEDVYIAAKRAAAADWAKQHPEELARIEQRASADFPAGAIGDIARKAWMVDRIGERIEFPSFDAWHAQRKAS
jgi:hypothetical protein